MADVIGIDVGYGYTKSFTLANGIQRKLIFPTAVSPYAPNVSFGVKIPAIRVDGKRFAVGEELVINGLPYENTVREGFVGSPSYMAVLGHVLSHTGFYGKAMVTGLPPTFFRKEKAEELSEQIRKQWFVDELGKPIPIPETIKIIPQGSGIFFSYVVNYPGIFEKNVLVVDIGYYTLDVVFFSGGKYIEGAAASFPMGAKRVYDEIRKIFSKVYGTFSKDDDIIDEIIRFGKYTDFGQEYSLDVRDIIESYKVMVNSTIKSHLGKVTKKVDYVLAGGGGISLFMETMKSVIPVNDPQFANAMGFYEYGKQFLKS
jgi:hypothetical protein